MARGAAAGTTPIAPRKSPATSPHFSYWPRSASRPGGPSRQEKAEERSSDTVEAFDAAGGPPGRDPERGSAAQTVASMRSAG